MTDDVKPARALDRSFGLVEFKFRRWSVELEENQTLDDTLDPKFWTNQAAKIMGHTENDPKGRGDIIEVRKMDSGLYAELFVTEVGKGFIKVVLVRAAEAPKVDVPEGSPLTTKWNVGKRSHDVVRVSDNQVMATGFQTKPSAVSWINDHMKAMAA